MGFQVYSHITSLDLVCSQQGFEVSIPSYLSSNQFTVIHECPLHPLAHPSTLVARVLYQD